MTPARSPRRPWPALSVVVLFVVGMSGLILLLPRDPNFSRDPAGSVALIGAFAAFEVVGALVIWRRPGNALGWVLASVGLLAAWGALADTYTDVAYEAGQGAGLVFSASVWISLWYWYPLIGLVLIFTPLLFPDGRPPSSRWWPVAWVAGLDLALITFLAAFRERVEFPGISLDNPLGIPGIEDPETSRLGSVLFGLLLALLVVSLASVVVRFVRSRGVECQQIKWLLFATFLAVSMVLFEELLTEVTGESNVPFAVVVALFPLAIAVAILRYRLYDIDVIINRTLVYGALTATLGLVYFGGVTLLQGVLRGLASHESSFAVVVSTLAIAALFNPLRRRIQEFIDRRFYRRKYDATKTLEAFSVRLRDRVDLDDLNRDLVSILEETMQPAHASLWLRDPGPRA